MAVWMPEAERRMQKLFPAAAPVPEKLEVLTFLCQNFALCTDQRLSAIHGGACLLGTSMSPNPGFETES